MGKKIFSVLAAVMLLSLGTMFSGCVKPQAGAALGPELYEVNGNAINIKNGPVIIVEDSFHYAGAEGVPSPQGSLKRQIFAGKHGEFVTVTIFNNTSAFVRDSVTDSRHNKWEYRIRQVTGPQWIRVVGSKSPCCVNLLRSEYLFWPDGEKWQKGRALPAADVPGLVVLVSFGTPIPEGLYPNTWVNDDLLGGGEPQLNYEPGESGLLIPGLSREKLEYLNRQETRALQVYQVE